MRLEVSVQILLHLTNRAYSNNAVVDNKIEATASTKGTTITVEDLFYNIPMRQRVYNQSVGEETKYILLLLQVFSMHYSSQGILFSLKEVRIFNKNYLFIFILLQLLRIVPE